MTNEDILKKAILTFGFRMQMIVAIEELSELQKEICKQLRDKGNSGCLAEEIADVEIMLAQLKIMFKCTESVNDWKIRKLDRLENRIAAAEKGDETP